MRAAVIGAGNMGRNHLRTYAKLNDVQLVALADINPEAERLADEYSVDFFQDFEKMLDTAKPDMVSVVVPTPLHFPIAKAVMTRGIHCLVEKPIASSPEEGRKLIELAKKHSVIFTVGHIEHYNPMIRKMKDLVVNREIGEITSVVVRRVGGFPSVEPKTDVIIDLAVHDIDIISHLLGRQPDSVYGHGSRTLHSSQVDSAEIFMDYGVASGFIQANWITPVKIRHIAVTGTNGYVEGNYITQELTYYKHNMKDLRDENFKNFVEELGEPEKRHIVDTPQEPLANELFEFKQAVLSGNASHLVKPEEACEALQIALTALKNQ